MQKIYIDESGSQTKTDLAAHPYFVVSMVRSLDDAGLKLSYKRFTKKYRAELLESNTLKRGEMFDGEEFLELKGSAFTHQMKSLFVSYFIQKPVFEVYYIILDNTKARPVFYDVPARSFNFLLKLAIEHYRYTKDLPDDEYHLFVDERNIGAKTKHLLPEYLNTELCLDGVINFPIHTQNCDSRIVKNIQIADVFANLCLSQLLTGKYDAEMNILREAGVLKKEFIYPLN